MRELEPFVVGAVERHFDDRLRLLAQRLELALDRRNILFMRGGVLPDDRRKPQSFLGRPVELRDERLHRIVRGLGDDAIDQRLKVDERASQPRRRHPGSRLAIEEARVGHVDALHLAGHIPDAGARHRGDDGKNAHELRERAGAGKNGHRDLETEQRCANGGIPRKCDPREGKLNLPVRGIPEVRPQTLTQPELQSRWLMARQMRSAV